MARSSLRRKPKPKRTWAEVQARQLFREAAAKQRCCAKCGSTGHDFDAHHVIERQYLRINNLPQFVALNALRLCPDCHGKHTRYFERVPLYCLTDENIEYALMLLGEAKGAGYLRKHYPGDDPRVPQVE